MEYLPPPYAKLKEQAKNLHKQYKGSTTKRLEMIRLIQMVAATINDTHPAAHDTLIGLYSFNHDKIADTSLTTTKMSCRFFSVGSDLGTTLSNYLDIRKDNKIDKSAKLIQLAALLEHTNSLDDKLPLPGYKNIEEFRNEIKTKIKSVLHLSKAHISDLFKRRPATATFLTAFADLPNKYDQTKKKNDGARDNYLNFLREFEHQCQLQHLDFASSGTNQDQSHQSHSLGYFARYSAILYVMMQIEAELQYMALSPERSELYRLCQLAINIDHSKDVPSIEKLGYLWMLGGIIPQISPLSYEPCSWQTEQFPQANNFLMEMSGILLKELINTRNTVLDEDPHPYLNHLRKAVNWGFGALVNMTIGAVAGNLVELPVGSRVISKGLGYLGNQRYGYPGRVMFERAGMQIERGLTSAVVGKSISTASNTIITTPGQIVYYPLSGIANIGNALSNLIYGAQQINQYEKPDYVKVLLSLPDDVFPAEKKTRLCSLEIIAPQQEAATITSSVATTPEEATTAPTSPTTSYRR